MLYPDPYDFLHLSNLNQDWKVHDLFYMKIQWIGRTIPGQGLLEHFLFRFFLGGGTVSLCISSHFHFFVFTPGLSVRMGPFPSRFFLPAFSAKYSISPLDIFTPGIVC